MKVLFLTQTNDLGPSSRYRVYQLLPLLREHGIQCEVSPAIDSETYARIYLRGGAAGKFLAGRTIWNQRRADLQRLDEFDAVFIQKGVFPGLYSGFERKVAARKPIIFDLDDAIWLPRRGGSPLLRVLHRETAVQEVLRCATAVIAGNDFLAEYAARFSSNVIVVPSSIDFAKYPRRSPDLRVGATGAVVGWIGSRTTLPYLRSLGPVFKQLDIIPRVIASGDPGRLGFDVEFRPWRLETEMEELAQIGIGISPLPDTPWECGKCGVKLLQYMASGIPVVASPVGVHKQIIQHGVNGFLAHKEGEWATCLRQLVADAELRQRMGEAGRQLVERNFSVKRAAEKVAAVLQDSAEKRNA